MVHRLLKYSECEGAIKSRHKNPCASSASYPISQSMGNYRIKHSSAYPVYIREINVATTVPANISEAEGDWSWAGPGEQMFAMFFVGVQWFHMICCWPYDLHPNGCKISRNRYVHRMFWQNWENQCCYLILISYGNVAVCFEVYLNILTHWP